MNSRSGWLPAIVIPSSPYCPPKTSENTPFVCPATACISGTDICDPNGPPFCRNPSVRTCVSFSICSERNNIPFTMEKIAVFTPIPSASVTIAMAANPGLFHNCRSA